MKNRLRVLGCAAVLSSALLWAPGAYAVRGGTPGQGFVNNPVKPTPEPAAMLVFAVGAAIVGGAIWKARRR